MIRRESGADWAGTVESGTGSTNVVAQQHGQRLTVHPGQPAGEAVASVLDAQFAVATAMVPQCLDDVSVEPLHDLRVAVRRSRTVLGHLRQVLPRRERRELAAHLRWVQTITGPTRDLDVLLLRWETLAAAAPVPRSTLAAVHGLFRARRVEAFETMANHLRSGSFAEGWAAWQAFVGAARQGTGRRRSDEPIEQLVAPRIERAAGRLVLASADIDASSPASALHDLRKRGRQLRYLVELFGEACMERDDVQSTIDGLKRVQDDLGRHQDDTVQIDLLLAVLPGLPGRSDDPDGPAAALGHMVSYLAADQREARRLPRRYEGVQGANATCDLPPAS